jgi:hypothetical protein
MSATQPATKPIGVNRRKTLRARLVTQLESRAPVGSSIGHTEDISEAGLLVLTRETFDPQTEVTIRFNLPPFPPGHPVECQGEVVRTEPGANMAIEFHQLKEDDREALAAYVRQTRAQG